MPRPSSGRESRPDGHFLATFPASVDALPRARHDFSRWLDQTGVAQDIIAELLVAFSELATNAVTHSIDSALHVTAGAWRSGGDLVLEMINAAPGAGGPPSQWDLQDELRSGGRGLQIVHALMDSVRFDRGEQDRLTVRCQRAIDDDA